MNMAINSKCDYAVDKMNSREKNISITGKGTLLGFMLMMMMMMMSMINEKYTNNVDLSVDTSDCEGRDRVSIGKGTKWRGDTAKN